MHERSAIITLVNHLPGAKSIWRWLARERSSMYLDSRLQSALAASVSSRSSAGDGTRTKE